MGQGFAGPKGWEWGKKFSPSCRAGHEWGQKNSSEKGVKTPSFDPAPPHCHPYVCCIRNDWITCKKNEAIKSNKLKKKKNYKPKERWRGSHMSNSSHGKRVMPASQCNSYRQLIPKKKKKNLAFNFGY